MKLRRLLSGISLFAMVLTGIAYSTPAPRPNILIAVSDNQSFAHVSAAISRPTAGQPDQDNQAVRGMKGEEIPLQNE